jgi:hypothetical protein
MPSGRPSRTVQGRRANRLLTRIFPLPLILLARADEVIE